MSTRTRGVVDNNATLRVDAEEAARLRAEIAAEPGHDACLILVYGGTLGRRHPLTEPLVIGREAERGLVVDSPDVSRQHARLMPGAGGWLVEDLGSTNGTQVNNATVRGVTPLASGDLLKVGGTIFKYLAGGSVEALFYDEIYRLTIYDGLTHVHNRRYLDEFLDREVSRSRRHARPLSVAMLDLDHFKAVNDRHGHLVGDGVLRELAARVSEMVRHEELLARFGGEEFALVLPESASANAWIFCQKICRAVSCAPFVVADATIPVTVSIGVAEWQRGMDVPALLRAADQALYRAKHAGRNRVMGSDVED